MGWQEDSQPRDQGWMSQSAPGAMYDPAANSMYLPEGMKPQDKAMLEIPEATTPWQAWRAGAEGTATGMSIRAGIAKMFGQPIDTGILPGYRVGENTGWWNSRLAAVAGLVTDLPLMTASMLGGSLTPAGPVGGAFSAGFVPGAMRQGWIDYATTGKMEVGSEVWEGTKGGLSFVAMNKVGEMVGLNQLVAAGIDKATAKLVMSGAIQKETAGLANQMIAYGTPKEDAVKLATQMAYSKAGVSPIQQEIINEVRGSTMNLVKNFGAQITAGVGTSAALEGRMPSPDEFIDMSIAMFGLHAAGAGAKKLQDAYTRMGRTPGEVARDIAARPSLLTELFTVTPEKKMDEAQVLRDIRKAQEIEVKGLTGGMVTPEERMIVERAKVPEDASPILRRAIEIAAKPERNTAEVEFLRKVETGNYGESIGVISPGTARVEAEKRVQELEAQAADQRSVTKVLTEEQKAKLAEAQKTHDQTVAFIKSKFQDDPAEMNARLRNLERSFAEQKRFIADEMTTAELKKRDAAAKANFVGKEVLVDGESAVVTGAKFDKVNVRYADGREETVTRQQVKDKPVAMPKMTIGMTEEQAREYEQLKAGLDTGDFAGIAKRYGLRLTTDASAVLPPEVASSQVYQTLLRGIGEATKDVPGMPAEHTDAAARVYYAMYESIAKRWTEAGIPRTVDEVFADHMMRLSGEVGSNVRLQEIWNPVEGRIEVAGEVMQNKDGSFSYIDPRTGDYLTFKTQAEAQAALQRPTMLEQSDLAAQWAKWVPEKTSTGTIKGAPEWVTKDKDYTKLVKQLHQLVEEGKSGRFWYEDSAAGVMKMMSGDVVQAERFIQLLAIYSPNTNIWNNTINAVRAYTQWKNGVSREAFHVGMPDLDKKAVALLYDGISYEGRKINSFYLNLMHDIVEKYPEQAKNLGLDKELMDELSKPATIDVWMYRSFGYKVEQGANDKASGKYSFSENTVRKVTAMLNAKLKDGEPEWTPHQVQAAIWTAMKSRYELPEVKRLTNEKSLKEGLIKLGPNGKPDYSGSLEQKRKHYANWREFAMKVPSEEAKAFAEANGRSFGDDISRMTQMVTWEAVPMNTDINSAAEPLRRMFTTEAQKLIMDDAGNDLLAARLGVQIAYQTASEGGWGGAINPNVISRMIPIKPLGKGEFSVDEVRRYASGIQFIYRQNAVPWLRPDNKPMSSKAAIEDQKFRVVKNERTMPNAKFDTLAEAQAFAAAKGGEVRGGKFARGVFLEINGLTPEAEQRILESLNKELGAGFTRLHDGLLVVNYRDDRTRVPLRSDEEFFAGIERVAAENRDLIKKGEKVWTEGEYGYEHNWQADPAGTAIADRSSGGSPDLQAWLLDRRAAFESLLGEYTGDKLADRQRELDLLANAIVTGRGNPSVADLVAGQAAQLYGDRILNQPAWHGTHARDIERFSTEHIGTGEGKNYVIYDDSRIDITKRLYQSMWYSPLSRAIESHKMDAMSADQWKAWLEKPTGGVKKEEIEWSGIKEWLNLQKGKVTKEQIKEFIDQGGVKVREVMLDANDAVTDKEIYNGFQKGKYTVEETWRPISGEGWAIFDADGNKIYEVGLREKWAIADKLNELTETNQTPKFAGYKLPGGENYRELLLTLPVKLKLVDYASEEFRTAAAAQYGERFVDQLSQAQRDLVAKKMQGKLGTEFQSSHWPDTPNVLAHLRADEITGLDGKKYLRVIEIQSDWGQKGKKEGFVSDGKLPAGWKVEQVKASKYSDELSWAVFDNSNTQVGLYGKTKEEAIASAVNPKGYTGGVPTAPFVTDTKSWTALAVKRAIKLAIDEGKDGVVFATGQQNADFYDLSKHVGKIEAKEYAGGTTLNIYGKDGQYIKGEHFNGATDPKIEEFVGKEMAQKIADSKGMGEWAGLDLKVGGEGMRAFYDQIVPQVVRDILKKLDPTVKMEEIPTAGKDHIRGDQEWTYSTLYGMDGKDYVTDMQGNKVAGPFENLDAARNWLHANDPLTRSMNMSFKITDKMREAAQDGMPLFQGEARAGYSPQDKMIMFGPKSDPSSTIHEGWHFFFDYYVEMAQDPKCPPDIKADVAKMFDYIGVSGMDEWSVMSKASKDSNAYRRWVEAHEKMATAGEKYVMTNDFPIVGLRSILNKFKSWMLDVYKTISALNVEISTEIRGVFDRMIGKDDMPVAYRAEEVRTKGVEIVPGFAAEQVAIQPYPDMWPEGKERYKINSFMINSQSDYEAAILRIQEVYPDVIKGAKSWKQSDYEAAKLLGEALYDGNPHDVSAMLAKLGAEGQPIDRVYRAKMMLLNSLVKDQTRVRDSILAKYDTGMPVSVEEQIAYLQSIERTHMAFQNVIEGRAAIGRALNQMKEIGQFYDAKDMISDVLHQSAQDKKNAQMQAQLEELLVEYRKKFGPEATVETIARIDKSNATLRDQKNFLKGAIEATAFEKFLEVWKAWGLLSGPMTTVVNILGTGNFMFMRPVVDLIASGVGKMRGAEQGEVLKARDAYVRFTSMIEAGMNGAKLFAEALKTETPTGKVDLYKQAIGGKAGVAARLPYRLMSAGDIWTQHMYRAGELQVLAIHEAERLGYKWGTPEAGRKVAEIMQNAPAEMMAQADAAAARMAFNEPNGGYGMAQTLGAATNAVPALNIIMPFKRTPINVADEMVRMSPFAPMSKTWLDAFNTPGIARDRAIAEATLGTAIFAGIFMWAASGAITGNGPPDPNKRRVWLGQNQPYSVKIGNEWYSYQRLQPVGTLIGIAADMHDVYDTLGTEDQDKWAKMASVAFANAVTNQTFLKGLADFVNALSDPDRYGPRLVQSFAASSVVPAFMSQTAGMMDENAREVYSIVDAIKNRMWGLRETLEPKIDWLGNPVKARENLLGVLPVATKEVSEDPVAKEAARLGVSATVAPKKMHLGRMTGKLGDVELSPEERTKFATESGQLAHQVLSQIVTSPMYQAMPEETPLQLAIKRKIFHNVLQKAHAYGATMALPPEKRMALLRDIMQKAQTPTEAH